MAGDPWDALRAAARALRLELPREFGAQAQRYLAELARWERAGRLTGYVGLPDRVRHLVVDSLMLLAVVPDPGAPLVDIGSGAGIPGLILKLARPGWEIALVEAGRRRANFLRDAVRTLGLSGITVHQGRAETLAAGELAGAFVTASMRAVVPGRAARALARPFLRPDGVLVLALGPGQRAADPGEREVSVGGSEELPWRRRFLIIPRQELDADVSRGTRRGVGAHDRGRQPEGRRREDDDRAEPGGRPGAG